MTESEHPFPSATWEWRKVKIRRPAGGHTGSATKSLRWFGLPPWPDRKPLTLTVKFRGGSECWYEVRARGGVGRFPGYICIDDIMAEVMRRGAGLPPPAAGPRTHVRVLSEDSAAPRKDQSRPE